MPGIRDRLLYYFHIIVEPCRFFSHTSDAFIGPCLTADWIEQGLACPTCVQSENGDYLTIHPED